VNDTTEFICPRRTQAFQQELPPNTWTSLASLGDGIGPSCSGCGSLHPDVFMEHVRNGWIIEPTDKGYKAYLDKPYTAEELERIKTSDAIWKATRQLKLDEGATADEATAAADEHWNKYEAPERKGRTVAKFYYQHLSAEQRAEFIELHNADAMKLAYPGYFYVRPFFTRAPGTEAANHA
jgi:hypothetical protein